MSLCPCKDRCTHFREYWGERSLSLPDDVPAAEPQTIRQRHAPAAGRMRGDGRCRDRRGDQRGRHGPPLGRHPRLPGHRRRLLGARLLPALRLLPRGRGRPPALDGRRHRRRLPRADRLARRPGDRVPGQRPAEPHAGRRPRPLSGLARGARRRRGARAPRSRPDAAADARLHRDQLARARVDGGRRPAVRRPRRPQRRVRGRRADRDRPARARPDRRGRRCGGAARAASPRGAPCA